MEWLPTARAEVVKVAVPADSVPVPSTLAPSRKLTLPVGVPPVPMTVAVNVTDCPERDGFGDDPRVVVVGCAPDRLVSVTSLPSPPT